MLYGRSFILYISYDEKIEWIVVNWLIGFHHLWYVMALAAGTVILFYLKKWIKNDWVLLIVALFLLIAGYLIKENFYIGNKVLLYRNALFMGFPFIFIGYFIKKMEKEIIKINKSCLFFIIIASLAVLSIESYFTKLSGYCDIHLSLLVLCPAVFAIVLRFSKYATGDGYVGKLASGVYFVHLLVIMFIEDIKLGEYEGYNILVLPLIFFLSMLLSAGIIEINKRIKIFL